MKPKNTSRFSPAITVILIFGVISLLGDMVYETARSANSQYFNILGVSAATVGLVFGVGEFLGYFLRLLAGVLSDRTGKHWVFMFIGYGMLLVVPLIGFTQNWNIIVILVLMERIGKSLRNPAKDTVLSSVAENQVGIGFAFGLQEALDQIGAFLGPLVFTVIFWFAGKQTIAEYQLGYKVLIIPFILLMLFLHFAYNKIQKEHLTPEIKVKEFRNEKLSPVFWVYSLFTLICTLGFVNFSTIGYHLKAQNLMTDGQITLIYSAAMAVDAVVALLIGKAYDRMKERTGKKTGGILVLALIPVITMLLPFLTLTKSQPAVIIGMILFGVVMGSHETVMRSAIADISPYYKRGTSYGVFNTAYGIALLGGAAVMGFLYDAQTVGLIRGLTVVLEIAALLVFYQLIRMISKKASA